MCSDLLAKKIKLNIAYEKSFSKVQLLVMFDTYSR